MVFENDVFCLKKAYNVVGDVAAVDAVDAVERLVLRPLPIKKISIQPC